MIELRGVSKRHGAMQALHPLNLHVAAGERVVLVGPSGAGKSTLLRMVNRLVEPDTGSVWVGGEDTAHVPLDALRRRLGYVIQSNGLFPHWRVADNIATVPRLLGWPAAQVQQRVQELMQLLQLPPELGLRWPHELSGGQQQRVGVARALAAKPQVLLLDEPFGALDPITRAELQVELLRLQNALGTTLLMVTHDIDEALRIGQRVAVLRDGVLQQVETPLGLLLRPANEFVRVFVGGSAAGLRGLALQTVAQRMRPVAAPSEGHADASSPAPVTQRTEEQGLGTATAVQRARALLPEDKLHEALSDMVLQGTQVLPVWSQQGQHVGDLHLSDVVLPPTPT